MMRNKPIKKTKEDKMKQQKKTKDEEFCNVCCNVYTKQKRSKLSCPECKYELCNQCCQTYLLSKPDSHCPNCKTVFSKEYLNENFNKTFVKEKLIAHQVDIIMELEKSLFPETLQYIADKKEKIAFNKLEQAVNYLTRKSQEYTSDIDLLTKKQNNIHPKLLSLQYWIPSNHNEPIDDPTDNPTKSNSDDIKHLQRSYLCYSSYTKLDFLQNKIEDMIQTNTMIEKMPNNAKYQECLSLYILDEVFFKICNQHVNIHYATLLFLSHVTSKILDILINFCSDIKAKNPKISPIRCPTNNCPGFIIKQPFVQQCFVLIVMKIFVLLHVISKVVQK